MAYKYLVPINYLLIEENLKNSLRQFGLLNPIVLSQGKIVDGIKRHYLCKRFKKKLYFQKLELNPYLLRLQLNLNREWTLPEIAYMYLNSSQELKKSLCFYLGIKEFPKLEEIFKLLISSKGAIKNSILGKLNISLLNDLVIWEEDSQKILEKFLKVKGTYSELKNLSILLKKAKIEGKEIKRFKKNAKEMELELKKTLYPKYFKDLKNFYKFTKEMKIPKEIKLEPPPFFEESYINFSFKLNSKNKEKIYKWFFENKGNIEKLIEIIK